MTRPHRHPIPLPAQGFSLVELLVAALLMAISSLGGTYLFTQATQQARAISETLQQQFEISNELAVIRDRNDRYTCTTLPCAVKVNGYPPNQEQYAPADPADIPAFRALCTSSLADDLISHINSEAPNQTGSTVRRTASTDPSTDLSTTTPPATPPPSTPPHRYVVTWRTNDADQRVLRQVQLIPTVAAWCP